MQIWELETDLVIVEMVEVLIQDLVLKCLAVLLNLKRCWVTLNHTSRLHQFTGNFELDSSLRVGT